MWHLATAATLKFVQSRRKEMNFGRLLKLIELDLVRNLLRILKLLPLKERRKQPYRGLLRDTKHWIERIRNSHE